MTVSGGGGAGPCTVKSKLNKRVQRRKPGPEIDTRGAEVLEPCVERTLEQGSV